MLRNGSGFFTDRDTFSYGSKGKEQVGGAEEEAGVMAWAAEVGRSGDGSLVNCLSHKCEDLSLNIHSPSKSMRIAMPLLSWCSYINMKTGESLRV